MFDPAHRPMRRRVAALVTLIVAGAALAMFLSRPAAAQVTASRDATAPLASPAGPGAREDACAASANEPWPLWEPQGSGDLRDARATSALWVAGRVLLAAVAVIAIAVGLLVGLRRFGVGRGASGIGAARLRLLANLSLGPRRMIYLVRVDGVDLLLGSNGDGLRLLTELPGNRDSAGTTLDATPTRAARGPATRASSWPASAAATPAATRDSADVAAAVAPADAAAAPANGSFFTALSQLLVGTPHDLDGGEPSAMQPAPADLGGAGR